MQDRNMRLGFGWIIFILSMAFMAMPVSAEMVARLPQVSRPFFITVSAGRLYIVEDASSQVHIYDRGSDSISFVKTFGRDGEGPGEFSGIHQIRVREDHLEIPTFGKFTRFSLAGQFIDEIKLPIRVFKNGIYRIGENYLVRDFRLDNKEITITIRLYSKDFKLVRGFGKHTMPRFVDKINLVMDYYSARVTDEKIYVIDSGKETIVTVYDKNGSRQKNISLPLEPVKISSALKEILLKPLKEEPDWRAGNEKLYCFPDWTPGLDYFDIVDGKFIARTYKYRENSVEFAIFDLNGRELQRVFLPNTGRLSNGILFCFFQGRFFYLRENIDEEIWELHSEKVW